MDIDGDETGDNDIYGEKSEIDLDIEGERECRIEKGEKVDQGLGRD